MTKSPPQLSLQTKEPTPLWSALCLPSRKNRPSPFSPPEWVKSRCLTAERGPRRRVWKARAALPTSGATRPGRIDCPLFQPPGDPDVSRLRLFEPRTSGEAEPIPTKGQAVPATKSSKHGKIDCPLIRSSDNKWNYRSLDNARRDLGLRAAGHGRAVPGSIGRALRNTTAGRCWFFVS